MNRILFKLAFAGLYDANVVDPTNSETRRSIVERAPCSKCALQKNGRCTRYSVMLHHQAERERSRLAQMDPTLLFVDGMRDRPRPVHCEEERRPLSLSNWKLLSVLFGNTEKRKRFQHLASRPCGPSGLLWKALDETKEAARAI